MRLVFVATTRFPHLGGQSTHIADLTRGLRDAGHEVEHVSLADLGDAFVKWAVFRPGYALDRLSMGLRLKWTAPVMETLLARKLREKAGRRPFDAVLAQDPLAWHAARKAFGTGVPITLTAHGYLVQEHLADRTLRGGGSVEAWLWGKEVSAYKGADQIVTVDTRIKDHVLAHGGDPARVTVLKNFVDTERFSPGAPSKDPWPGKKVVLCPRRLVPKNGVRYAALAAKPLGDPYLVVIPGDGPERASIEAESPPNSVILGAVPHAELPDMLRRADAVAIPSVTEQGVQEATSISALEGMAVGKPVVASAIGGLKELIRDGENGLLVPERDVAALAAALRRVVEDKALGERLGRAAREDVLRQYSLQARTADYVAIVERAIAMRA